VHGRANNYSVADDQALSNRSLVSVHEGLMRCLHHVEGSSLFLVSRLESLEEKELKAMRELEKANKEITQL